MRNERFDFDRYGVPYMGSKNALAERVVQSLPGGGVFYDLFAGGCSVTHAALLSGKWSRYVANDLGGWGVDLFRRSVAGEFRNEKRWISREDFFALKDKDSYVRLCWSFGNNQEGYMYAKEVEPWKKALHWARVLGDCSLLREMGIEGSGSRKDVVQHMEAYKTKYIRWWLGMQRYSKAELDEMIERCKGDIAKDSEELRQYLLAGLRSSGLTQSAVMKRLGNQMASHYFGKSQWAFPTEEIYRQMQEFMPALDKDYNDVVGLRRLWESLESLESLESPERLQSLERLERLQSLESLERLKCSKLSYDEVEIEGGGVVYCDPPYRGTAGYGMEFDHEAFYDWCERQRALVVVSEYQMPEERFECVKEFAHTSKLSGSTGAKCNFERLFVPKGQAEMYRQRMGLLF